MAYCWQSFEHRYPRLAHIASNISLSLPPLNFITIHYAYFLVSIVVSSLVFWGSSEPALSISYTDSLFLVVSAMTESGLNTVNLSQMTTWQQIILFVLIIFGSSIWVSIWTIVFRKHVFEQRFDAIVRASRGHRIRRPPSTDELQTGHCLPWPVRSHFFPRTYTQGTPSGHILPNMASVQTESHTTGPALSVSRPAIMDPSGSNEECVEDSATEPAQFRGGPDDLQRPPTPGSHITFVNGQQQNASSGAYRHPENRPTRRAAAVASTAADTHDPYQADEKRDRWHAWDVRLFLTHRTVGRNSQFHDLTREEREQLGGCEYRALKLLSAVVPLYFALWQVLGCVGLGAWMRYHAASVAWGNGINPWWLGIFNGASAFNNSGMSLLDANMVPFQDAHYVLITMGLMIFAGNTAYPVFLRLIFWSLLRLLRSITSDEQFSDTKETLEFILKYPRRVYTNLFPSRPTWWLLFMIVLLNCIDWVAFELLNLGNPSMESIPKGSRILDGLFQAIAVRSGGFYVIPMPNVYIGLQVLYVIMMYISVYPVVITMRHSNVYEERSLGIYSDDHGNDEDLEEADVEAHNRMATPGLRCGHSRSQAGDKLGRALRRTLIPWHGVGVAPPPSAGSRGETRISFISQQIHGQLAHDLWWLVLTVLVITTIETSHFLTDPATNSVFNVIFEVVSAYGCVGISIGLPTASYSFSGGWHKASKLALCLVMIRGRHRGLPVALDRAIRLPGEQLQRDEEEDYRIRRGGTNQRRSDGSVLGAN